MHGTRAQRCLCRTSIYVCTGSLSLLVAHSHRTVHTACVHCRADIHHYTVSAGDAATDVARLAWTRALQW